MIFVTVGSQAPFDRLIRAIDEWAGLRDRSDVFAQVAGSTYRPRHIDYTDFIDPSEFNRWVEEADVLVAHAGMGSIISALEVGKPIVVMPRRVQFRETRNDHQVAAAQHFGAQGQVIVANDEQELAGMLDYVVTFRHIDRIGPQASARLLATIRAFIDGNPYQLYPAFPIDHVDSGSVGQPATHSVSPAYSAAQRRAR